MFPDFGGFGISDYDQRLADNAPLNTISSEEENESEEQKKENDQEVNSL